MSLYSRTNNIDGRIYFFRSHLKLIINSDSLPFSAPVCNRKLFITFHLFNISSHKVNQDFQWLFIGMNKSKPGADFIKV